ncbi:hypothetical protein CONPUDRAFT_156692 [Coniophora puteana RWD-64-598 SS2]|uniref:Uncharacterized protein n=1 Tax=Coniophora puteana (strain RWD-64-598) TaxID=741705 RepID=A0A5M3MIX2_CONPW|nr:uncharacterized protein CONPUDRAFT_156692 [Coniophora puteana RWD-64-598 SS2]EIW78734.1 hypothetical protein CONPUDRAFT_156692 [Coniophora puteana RWD-64-598 SS2]
MVEYLNKDVVPYFNDQKQCLGYPDNQECVVILDCWSVHQSKAFCWLVYKNWPWIRLHFIPGGTTGKCQLCDVRIQRTFKHTIKRAQHQDMINEALAHLNVDDDPDLFNFKLDTRLATL